MAGARASTAERRTIAVIGAGIVGVATASFLLRKGHDVVLIDPASPGEGASFGNAGCFNGSSVVPLSMPGIVRAIPKWLTDPLGPLAVRLRYLPRLTPWLLRFLRSGTPAGIERQARALRSLLEGGIETLAPLVHNAGAQDLVQRLGHLYVYRSLASWDNEQLAWALRSRNGIGWDEFNAHELRQLDPALSRAYVKGVLVRENGHTADPHALVLALARAFARDGGRIERRRALTFDFAHDRLLGVRCEGALVAAERAVIAAGIWSKSLATELGDRVPLESERGYHLMIRNAEVTPRIPTADAEAKFVATPMRGGLRLAGTVELAGLDAPPNWNRAHVLLRHAQRMYPALAAHYSKERITTWMGHRPSTPDSLPVIGPARRSRDVIYAFGHGHIGMSCAARTGRAVAELISGEAPSLDLSPFAARRFS